MNKQVKFNQKKYNAVDGGQFIDFDFQINIYKEDNSLEEIYNDVKLTEKVEIYEDDTLIAVYEGYTQFKSLYTYELGDDIIVTVALDNADIINQVNNLTSSIMNLESSITDLTESQATQDLAIEDLAEVVSDLVEEEE